jgi:hypothetical protein
MRNVELVKPQSVLLTRQALTAHSFYIENAALAQEKEAMEEAMGSGTNTFSKVSFVPPMMTVLNRQLCAP